ncbi:MAG: hypothetical protein ABFS08_05855, partial [Pseudomonadota bacterium]
SAAMFNQIALEALLQHFALSILVANLPLATVGAALPRCLIKSRWKRSYNILPYQSWSPIFPSLL